MRHARALVLLAAVILVSPGRLLAQRDRPDVSIDGVIWAQYQYLFEDAADDFQAFDLKRAYVNVRAALGKGVTSRVTSDVYRVADGSLSLRLKYAYLTWRPEGSALGLTGGMMQTPWVDHEETLWGWRMQGSIALDRNGYLTSSDIGVGVDGAWAGGDVAFQGGVFNGEGYDDPEGDRGKDAAARVTVRLVDSDDASRTGGLQLSAFGHHGSPVGGGVRQRAAGMLSFRSKAITLAGQAALTRDRLDDPPAPDVPDAATVEGRLLSAFGVVRLGRQPLSLIGRVDHLDPDVNVAGDRETRWIAGVGIQATRNLRLLANVDHVRFEGGAPAPATATQGLLQAELVF